MFTRNGYGDDVNVQSYHFVLWNFFVLVWIFGWWKENNPSNDIKPVEKATYVRA